MTRIKNHNLKADLQLYNIYNRNDKNQPFINFLKLSKEDAVFDSAGRLFHILAPRKEKHFCPLADLFFGNVKSVSVFRRLREEHAEFLLTGCKGIVKPSH